MKSILHRKTIQLLGLEPDLWEKSTENEIRSFSIVFLLFVVFVIVSVISSISMMYMITSGLIISIITGIFMSYVVCTIFRFSLVILRRSLYDHISKNNQSVNDPEVDAFLSKISLTTNYLEKLQFFLQAAFIHIRNMLKKILTGTFDSNKPVLFLAPIIRFSILTILSFILIFPLSCLLSYTSIIDFNEQLRESLIGKNEIQPTIYHQKQIISYRQQINQLQNETKALKLVLNKSDLCTEKENKIILLEESLKKTLNEQNTMIQEMTDRYRNKLEGRYFIIASFKHISGYPLCWVVSLLITFLIWIPHIILYRIKKNPNSIYASLSTNYYKQSIEEIFHLNEKYKQQVLVSKYNVHLPIPIGYDLWENPPYCTIPKQPFQKKVITKKISRI